MRSTHLSAFTLSCLLTGLFWSEPGRAVHFVRLELGESTDILFSAAAGFGGTLGMSFPAQDGSDAYCEVFGPGGVSVPLSDSPLVDGGCYTPLALGYQRTFVPRDQDDVGLWRVECDFWGAHNDYLVGDPTLACPDPSTLAPACACAWRNDAPLSARAVHSDIWEIDVVPRLPELTVTGNRTVDINDTIALDVSPYLPELTYEWNMRRPGSPAVHYNVATGSHLAVIADAVGDFRFYANVRLGDDMVSADPYVVTVRNPPPRIALMGAAAIEAGDLLAIETTILSDDDGGDLTFEWEPVQMPVAALAHLSGVALDRARIEVPTNAASAGTWSFVLTACDDEVAVACESERFDVHVDGRPTANISGPDVMRPFEFPLTLSAEPSVDPDSDCSGGRPLCDHWVADGWDMTPIYDTFSYRWYVDSVPSEHSDVYGSGGPVGTVFGTAGTNEELGLELDQILPGNYRFRLRVDDLEGNYDDAWHDVEVRDLDAPPVARLPGARRYLVDLYGAVTETVTVDGGLSFDPDILYGAGPIPADGGIVLYSWNLDAPAGCPDRTYGDQATITPFAAGAAVPPDCLGTWNVELTVTDGDGDTDTEQTEFILGNCEGDVCIDFPTYEMPAKVGVGGVMDIDIYYHVDPTVYEAYPWGFYVQLDVVPSGGGASVYTAYDTAAWSSGPGSIPTFYWGGYVNVGPDAGTRAPTGDYNVALTVVDSGGALTGLGDLEPLAIQSENPSLTVLASSDRYVPRPALEDGTDQFNFTASLSDALGVDTWLWTVRNRDGAVATRRLVSSSALTLSDSWNGRSGAVLQPPGQYTLEVAAFRDAQVLATALATFTVFELRLEPVAGGERARVLVNRDDDDADGISDLGDSNVSGGDDDLVELTLSMEPRIAGTATINTPGYVALYGGATKAMPCAPLCSFSVADAPLEEAVFLEGRAPGRTELQAEFVTTFGDVLPPTPLRVDVVGLDVLDMTGTATSYVRLGMWDGAYDAAGLLLNDPDPASNFIDLDLRRFSVRLTDPGANEMATARETVTARIGTLFEMPYTGTPDYTDPLTEITLTETSADSGVFVSETQILTSNDEPTLVGAGEVLDDDIAVQTTDGLVVDEAFGDRSHRVGRDADNFLRGGVRVEVGDASVVSPVSVELPVCRRETDARSTIWLDVTIWEEPFTDEGYHDSAGVLRGAHDGAFSFEDDPAIGTPGVHHPLERSEPYFDLSEDPLGPPVRGGPLEPGHMPPRGGWSLVAPPEYVEREVASAKMSWASSCVDFLLGAINTRRPPATFNFVGNAYVFDVSLPDPFEALYPSASRDVVYVDVLGPEIYLRVPSGAATVDVKLLGYARIPQINGLGPDGLVTHLTLASNVAEIDRTLAHEMGHALTNMGDDEFGSPPLPRQWFFPMQGLEHVGAFHEYRRYPLSVGFFVGTARLDGPADRMSPGSTLRRPYTLTP